MAKANVTAVPAIAKDAIDQQDPFTNYALFKRTDRQFTRLKAKKGGKHPFYDLPFVSRSKATHKGEARAWDVPAAGGYLGGYETGEAMAQAFLKCQKVHSDTSGTAHRLTQIVQSFMIRFEQEGGVQAWNDSSGTCKENEGAASLRGQCAGFFNTLSDWLDFAARDSENDLDELVEKDLIDRANIGLQLDHSAYSAYLTKRDHMKDVLAKAAA